jgi:hypothetical protein
LAYVNNISVSPGLTFTVVVGGGGSSGGASGGVRIVWPGQTRQFPNTVVSNCGSDTTTTNYIPQAPTIVSAVANSGTMVTVTYTAPTYKGGSAVTSYTAVSSPGGITASISTSGSYFIRVDGLSPLTTYSFTAYATNSYGNSAVTSALTTTTTA